MGSGPPPQAREGKLVCAQSEVASAEKEGSDDMVPESLLPEREERKTAIVQCISLLRLPNTIAQTGRFK